jgi:hypothetical protein
MEYGRAELDRFGASAGDEQQLNHREAGSDRDGTSAYLWR